MQRISVSNLEANMVPAYNVFSSDGVILIRAGITLTDPMVKRLQNMGIGSIYIANPLFAGIELPELVQEDTRVEAIKTVQSVYTKFKKTNELDVQPLKLLAGKIVEDVTLHSDAMVHSVDTRTYEDYMYGNAVNVAILSVLTGLILDYSPTKLRDLALGALVHDIGLLLIPPEIVNKPAKLTPEEMTTLRKHTEIGFEILRKIRDIPIPASHIAYQHHENFDGTGYPRSLKGEEIHEYARIVSIANMYDALISDRTFRKGFLPHEAYELLMTLSHKYLDSKILDIFLANVATYPIGSIVRINTGEFGMVTKVLPRLQTRPVIKVLTDPSGQRLADTREIDLTEQLTTFITKLLTEKEVIEFGKI